MRVTIKDVAEKAGLSVSTVSLVLNHKPHRISEETRQRVLQVARELNYHPNRMAVSLIKNRTNTIGLLIPDITNMFFAEIAKGAEVGCQELGYSMILCNTNDNPQKDIDYVNVLLERGVDGIIFVMAVNSSNNKARECYDLLRQFEKPVVLVDRTVEDLELPSVSTDNELGGYLATRHLLELGHRRIGCITGPMGSQSSKRRLFGYIRALQEYAVPFRAELVAEGNYHADSGYRLSRRLLKSGVTAILACNDMMSYGVYRRARRERLRIPEDLSVVGFDDVTFSEMAEVPLTTVAQPAYRIGRASVEKLLELLQNGTLSERTLVFPPELIVRRSTAPPVGREEARESESR